MCPCDLDVKTLRVKVCSKKKNTLLISCNCWSKYKSLSAEFRLKTLKKDWFYENRTLRFLLQILCFV